MVEDLEVYRHAEDLAEIIDSYGAFHRVSDDGKAHYHTPLMWPKIGPRCEGIGDTPSECYEDYKSRIIGHLYKQLLKRKESNSGDWKIPRPQDG